MLHFIDYFIIRFETAKCPATVVADVDPSWKKVSSKVEVSFILFLV